MTARPEILLLGTRDHRVFAQSRFAPALQALGFDDPIAFARLLEAAPVVRGGRAPHRLVDLRDPAATPRPDGACTVRLRPVLRGGWPAEGLPASFRAAYSSPARAVRELERSLSLEQAGVALATPVAVVARRRSGLWSLHFVSVERATARDGLDWLAANPNPNAQRRGIVAVARAVRRLHDAGIRHGDLHLKNLLLEDDGNALHCLFVDLDRAWRPRAIPPRARSAELARLARSLEKHDLVTRIGSFARARFLLAYCAGDHAMLHGLLAARTRERFRLALHRLAWRFARRRPSTARRASAITAASLFAPLGTVIVLFAWLGWFAAGAACRRAEKPAQAGLLAESPDDARFSLLAVGDVGRVGSENERWGLFEGQLAVARALEAEDRRAPIDALAFLGDNFYEHGLSRETLVARVRETLVRPYCRFVSLTGERSQEVADACPSAASERHPVPLLAVLGNHDLKTPESAELERVDVRAFLPDWTMSDSLARVVELAPGVSVVLFESEVAIDHREVVKRALAEALLATRGPWRILIAHRPIATDDVGKIPHGGYPDWMRDAIAQSGIPVQLALCGHHHSLQAFALEAPTRLLQIGAGSGSRADVPVALGHPALRFAAGELGFARVDLVGAASDERLVVSLYGVARWPWLAALRPHALRARFAVDPTGVVETRHAEGFASRPAS